nr:MAG TPA: hypothetical protein [Caudoviricetes sp.]
MIDTSPLYPSLFRERGGVSILMVLSLSYRRLRQE